MSGSKFFSGPPSNKATASTLAAAVATLFWTIAAHTFWKTMSTADMTLYITTSTVLLTAITGFVIPESAAFTDHNKQRLDARAATQGLVAPTSAIGPANAALETQLQAMQELQTEMAARLGIAQAPAIPVPNQ
jgi:hypothetical protein